MSTSFYAAVLGHVPAPYAVAWERPTFAVDDVDATTKRAWDLGGTVLVPPYDDGPLRMAFLRDPQGTAFAVSAREPVAG